MTGNAVIVGGGITGLSAAYYLRKAGVPCVILEGSSRVGGKVRTTSLREEGGGSFLVEEGPDSFVSQKPWLLELLKELEMESEVAPSRAECKKTYLHDYGAMTPLPDGMHLMIPTRVLPFAGTRLLSLRGKLRAMLEPLVSRARVSGDESVGSFLKRRFGREILDKLAEPLLSGIFNTPPERQSMDACFPHLRAIESQGRSLLMTMCSGTRSKTASPFLTIRGGMERIVHELRRRLKGCIRTGVEVESLHPSGRVGYVVRATKGEIFHADHVILALPAAGASKVLASASPVCSAMLRTLPTVHSGAMTLAYHAKDCSDIPPGYGMLYLKDEDALINGVTFTSQKFSGRSPEAYKLLRVYFGGSRTPHTYARRDEEVRCIVRGELTRCFKITAAPLFAFISRWPSAVPQYEVGHLDRVASIERELPEGVYLAGASYRGASVPDCVRQGREAASKVSKGLAERAPYALSQPVLVAGAAESTRVAAL